MSAPLIPDPYGLEFRAWGALVAEQLAEQGVEAPTSEAWQDWAASLQYAPALAAVPEPGGFPTWESWASSLVQTQLR